MIAPFLSPQRIPSEIKALPTYADASTQLDTTDPPSHFQDLSDWPNPSQWNAPKDDSPQYSYSQFHNSVPCVQSCSAARPRTFESTQHDHVKQQSTQHLYPAQRLSTVHLRGAMPEGFPIQIPRTELATKRTRRVCSFAPCYL